MDQRFHLRLCAALGFTVAGLYFATESLTYFCSPGSSCSPQYHMSMSMAWAEAPRESPPSAVPPASMAEVIMKLRRVNIG